MGCTSKKQTEDILEDQIWEICKDTGIIQLRNPLPLELVYKFPHNDGTGKVWENHYQELANFINSFKVKNVLEIRGGAGRLGKLFLSKKPSYKWTMLEPNYSYQKINIPNFKHIKKWFNNEYNIEENHDAIIHSHVFEHVYNPIDFLKNIHNQMDDKMYHIFSFPNLYKNLKDLFTNQLNFEHTTFLTEEITDLLLIKIGFNIIKKQYCEHSIFYACTKTQPKRVMFTRDIYKKNKDVFLNYINHYKKEILDLNKQIKKHKGEIFLFGGHIFSQFLIFNGLNTDKIKCILDNSKMKQKKRLYGTSFIVNSPDILKSYNNPAVILKTASYNEEIKKDILNNINKNTIFFE